MTDGQGRLIDYLRVSVTDRCNLRCRYCMPGEGVSFIAHDHILRYEEIVRIAGIFARLGIRKVRITGGEPLVRKGLPFLFEKLGRISGIDELTLTTNGTLLAPVTGRLGDAGVKRVNISLDSLENACYRLITGFDRLRDVHEGIDKAIEAGMAVKLNVVAMRGINDGEFVSFVRFAIDRSIDVRFIELMRGRYNGDFVRDRFLSSEEVYRRLCGEFTLIPVSPSYGSTTEKSYSVSGTAVRVGLISGVSDPFCGRCNKVRLMSQGVLKTCLFDTGGINLRDMLRGGLSEEEIEEKIKKAVEGRSEGPAQGKNPEGPGESELVMHRTGG